MKSKLLARKSTIIGVLGLLSETTGFQYVRSSSILNRPQGFLATRKPSVVALFAESEESSSTGGSVRFSATDGLTSTTTNPLDAFLSLLASDVVSIGLGLLGLIVVVAHRLSLLDDNSAENLALQTRTDLLAVFACGSVLLNGVTKLDVTAAMAEEVVLEGTNYKEAQIEPSVEEPSTVAWAMDALTTATPAKSAVVLELSSTEGWQIIARSGVLPEQTSIPDSTPVLDRVSSPGNSKESYLPTLQALPGKREFPYLPSNAQLALLIPITTSNESPARILVLGSNRAKSFTPRDVAWCRIVAERMASSSCNQSAPSSNEDIQMRQATIDDLELVTKWDEQDYLQDEKKFGDAEYNQWNWEYELGRDKVDWRDILIAEYKGRPIGVVQVIDPSSEESCYWGDDGKNPEYIMEFCRPNYRAIDIWIGEPEYLGMGLGTVMMQQTLRYYCFADPTVTSVLVDPMASHTDAIRFYEKKCGFEPIGLRNFGPDECLVHRLERSKWEAA